MRDYARATREPLHNVHFCGSDTATEWAGYMDGAIESGERVAHEVLYTMYGASNKSIQVDYKKTYYHQRDLIQGWQAEERKEVGLSEDEPSKELVPSTGQFSNSLLK